MGGDTVAPQAAAWNPVFEESGGRKVSAPRRWLCGITDIGKRRANNEDAYFLSEDGGFWIVADGMGGHAAGELASALTIETIAEAIEGDRMQEPLASAGAHGERLRDAFNSANERVCSRGRSDTGCEGMGSTAIAGWVMGDALHICHAGDARAYHFSHGRFRQVTNDHSMVWHLVMSGLIDSEQARLHPHRGRVTQAIGMAGVQPEVTRLLLEPGDRVLLCSDGLWEAAPEREISAIAASGGSMLELASALVDKANAASGHDNITVVLYEHRREEIGKRHYAVAGAE
jgi:protein phosphatase